MPILICHDCDGEYPGTAKTWRYPCEECATAFLREHRGAGHEIRAREETYGDRFIAWGTPM